MHGHAALGAPADRHARGHPDRSRPDAGPARSGAHRRRDAGDDRRPGQRDRHPLGHDAHRRGQLPRTGHAGDQRADLRERAAWACAAPSSASSRAAAAPAAPSRGRSRCRAAQAAAFGKGLLYVQLQSEKAPDGNLWGWLTASEGTTLMTRTRLRPRHTWIAAATAAPRVWPWPPQHRPRRRRRPARQRPRRSSPQRRPPPAATLYQARCAGCHLADLGGRNDAPPLAGASFLSVWRDALDRRARRLHPRRDAARRPDARRRRGPRAHRVHPAPATAPGPARRAGATACPSARATGAPRRRAGRPPRRPPPCRAPRRRPRAATTCAARCRASRRSPTRCCARRRRATG